MRRSLPPRCRNSRSFMCTRASVARRATAHAWGNCSNKSAQRSAGDQDRKSTRLNSSHEWISYAVFCLKKKNKNEKGRERHDGGRRDHRDLCHTGDRRRETGGAQRERAIG